MIGLSFFALLLKVFAMLIGVVLVLQFLKRFWK